MSVGRYVCVALPFILTVGSIISMLIAGLTGVTNNGLFIFEIDTRNVTIDAESLQSLIGNITNITNAASISDQVDNAVNNGQKGISQNIYNPLNQHNTRSPAPQDASDISGIISSLTGSGDNITAAELGIDKIYQFTLWNYCSTTTDGAKNCTKAKFNWAEEDLNTSWVDEFGKQLGGANITIPDEVNDTLSTFKTLIKWTEVVYVIAMIGLALELAVGLFTACSRFVSCLTWVISGIATAFVIAAASMMTALAVIVVGVTKTATSKYGGDASWNNNFLACVWIGVAFALGASFFWLFSICCCKPENRPYNRRSGHGAEGEKFIPTGSYAPLGDNRNSGYNYGAPQRGGARSDLAYEPYSHAH